MTGEHVEPATEPHRGVVARGRNRRAVLTPYPIPPELRGKKVVNVGDGLILRAIERLLGPFAEGRSFSSRVPPTATQRAALVTSQTVILAGANQLHDSYTIWPGLTADDLRETTLRFVPFGVGLHGHPGFNDGMSTATRALLLEMHERIRFSSWRCPRTVDYLRRELPELAPQLLMTGCPVVYDRPLLEGTPFAQRARRVAVTVTERHDFWEREKAIIDFVAARFPRARRHLVLHQNWSPPSRLELLRHRWLPQRPERLDPYQKLRQYAVRRGFSVVCPADADACRAFYGDVDVHVGSRLHAHLLMLSLARRSWLVPVDGRSLGIAESLDFPLQGPERLEQVMDFDFERVRARAREHFRVMRRFVESLPE